MPPVPLVENIHQKIESCVNGGDNLDMSAWHSCETTHCRAGWAIHLAGKEGYALEMATSASFAAMQIFKKSAPEIKVRYVDFHKPSERALEDIKTSAGLERNLNKE